MSRPVPRGGAGQGGSATIAALGLLILLAAAAAGAAAVQAASLSYAGRSRLREEAYLALETAADGLIRALAADPTPLSDSPLDPVWDAVRQAGADGIELALSDAGTGLDPNWVQEGVLEKTALGDLLAPGRTPQELQQRREDRGPAADILLGYGDMFREGTLERHWSAYGYANVNTTDEFVLRKLYALRTGDEAAAEAFHGRIQRLLQEGRLAKPSDLAEILGPGADALYPLVNAEPLLNVHYADGLVLTELLSYPDWKVPHPEAAARRILDSREGAEIRPEDLKGIVGAPEDSRIWQYLGTVTWFWKVRASRGGRSLEIVLARLPGGGTPRFRVVEERRTP